MNEYVEISKIYSSPESSNFINGVANNVFKYLTDKNEIKKYVGDKIKCIEVSQNV